MYLYRIVQDASRVNDLTGTGAYRFGGRWNSKGTYMLYASENSSLALLESLVHFDKIVLPPKLHIIQLELKESFHIYTVPKKEYAKNWEQLALLENQYKGDEWMKQKKYGGFKVRSAINTTEHNFLLNPLYPGFFKANKITLVSEIEVDNRLV